MSLLQGGQQLKYAAGSQQKRLQPAGGFSTAASSGTLPSIYNALEGGSGPSMPASPKPPSASTSNNAPTGGGSGGGAGAPPPAPFDLNADPVLQQVQAQMSSANSMANSSALSQEEQALLQLGDPALAQSILGANDPMLAAIGNNPESQYAQLHRQYGQQLRQFDTTIDPSLVNSGYRVEQEGNMAQGLQDALAQAASGFQSQYQGIKGQLAQELAQNADTLSQAYSDAYNRAVQQQLARAAGGA